MGRLNTKGVTLVELLGAVAISSLGIALAAAAMVLIIRATNDTIMNNRANTTAMIITTTAHNHLSSFVATDIAECPGVTPTTCFILEKKYERTLDPATNKIKDIPVSPIQTLKIEVKNNPSGQLDLFLNDASVYDIYSLEGVPFRYSSITLTYDPLFPNIISTGSGTYTLITVRFTIQDLSNREYPYVISYSFRARDPIT